MLPAILSCRPAEAADVETYCGAIRRAVPTTLENAGPAMIRSYQPGPSETILPLPLATTAFSYDNALAIIALLACRDTEHATRIADAFLLAIHGDRKFHDGRIRNGYRAGPVSDKAIALPGWWNADARRWEEDAYQDGTATGNVAWVALALLNTYAQTSKPSYRDAALLLLDWIGAHAADPHGKAGFTGGQSGFDGAQSAQTWKATEHNIDIAAAATWAFALTQRSQYAEMAHSATSFVAEHFIASPGYFALGTEADGADANPQKLALDVQVWPQLAFAKPPADWLRAVAFSLQRLRSGDGMTFAGIGPNRWTEGTAQTVLTLRKIGENDMAARLSADLVRHGSTSGLLLATSAGEVPTGLKVESENGGDFEYFHRPHLGATAWAVLALTGWNPFDGRKIN